MTFAKALIKATHTCGKFKERGIIPHPTPKPYMHTYSKRKQIKYAYNNIIAAGTTSSLYLLVTMNARLNAAKMHFGKGAPLEHTIPGVCIIARSYTHIRACVCVCLRYKEGIIGRSNYSPCIIQLLKSRERERERLKCISYQGGGGV